MLLVLWLQLNKSIQDAERSIFQDTIFLFLLWTIFCSNLVFYIILYLKRVIDSI